MILGYWNIRGLAQPIRLLLEYAKIPYEDKRYTAQGPPSWSRKEWTDVKFTLGFDFPNLPYLIDGTLKITQSSAIIRYVARKADMMPTNNLELAQLDMLESEIADFRERFVEVCYQSQDVFEKKKLSHFQNLPEHLQRFQQFLSSRKWLNGERISHVDFMFYEMLSAHSAMFPDLLNSYPALKNFKDTFESLPQLDQYFKSDRFIKRPFNNPSASFK